MSPIYGTFTPGAGRFQQPSSWSPGGFREQLCGQGHETLTDPDERRALAKLLRAHRAVLASEQRATVERLQYLEAAIVGCDRLIEPLEGDPETEA